MRLGLKITFAIILCVLSLGIMENVPAAGSQEPLSTAMEATGAKVEEFSVNAWVKLPNTPLNDDQLGDIVGQVMSQLDVAPQNYQITNQQANKHNIVQAEVQSPTFHVLVIAQVAPIGFGKSETEGYLVVNVESKAAGNLSVRDMQEKIGRITKKFGDSPQISTCLIGWLDGKLRDGEWHEPLEKAFMVADAKIVDKLETEHFASYTGFTPGITDWLQISDKKINLNMAIRYSKYDNRTYITIGSPIITREY